MEVMVSFMVLAVGLLGMAALQGNSLRYSMQAYFQTQSVILNYDIFDRMRANPAGVAGGSYTPDTMPASFTLDCDSTMCTPSQLATYDLVEWNQDVASYLPGGTATLSSPSAGLYTVTINWLVQEKERGVDDVASTETARTHSMTAGL